MKYFIYILLIFFVSCQSVPQLNSKVKLLDVSAKSPAKDKVIVILTVFNNNNIQGKITVGATVNCGTVTWHEKRKTVTILAETKSIIEIEFVGIRDRIPTMAKEFTFQGFLYGSKNKLIEKSDEKQGKKPYGRP